MTAQFKEIVMDAYALDTQHILPQQRELGFHICSRRLICFACLGSIRLRQRPAIHLPIPRYRQLPKLDEG
ncbi:hypothetical protein L5D93_03095 [Paenibacillus thiaminolyticus]|nr:hypothetical protein [Paenibacillus thiaminolyticus]